MAFWTPQYKLLFHLKLCLVLIDVGDRWLFSLSAHVRKRFLGTPFSWHLIAWFAQNQFVHEFIFLHNLSIDSVNAGRPYKRYYVIIYFVLDKSLVGNGLHSSTFFFSYEYPVCFSLAIWWICRPTNHLILFGKCSVFEQELDCAVLCCVVWYTVILTLIWICLQHSVQIRWVCNFSFWHTICLSAVAKIHCIRAVIWQNGPQNDLITKC